MKHIEYLIIGAGISGLTFANYCKDNYLIVEKENEVGGYCKTIKKGEFTWDYAGHFFHFNTEEFKNKFLQKIPKEDIIYNTKCTKIYYKDKFIDYPFQSNIHELDKEEFIDCLYDLFNKEEKDNYNNFLDMLYSKFGKSIVEKFLKPYNEKLYATNLQDLDVDAMGRFFPYANKEEIIKNMKNSIINSYNNTFLYPKNGAGSFIKILYDSLNKNNIILNTSVEDIDIGNKIVILSDKTVIKYKYLINTIPLNNFLKLLKKYDNVVRKMSYNKVLVFNLGFNKPSLLCTNEHWLYIPSKDINFYRCGFYNKILGTKNLSMYIEIGYGKNQEISKEEIDKQLKLTLKGLKEIGIINDDINLKEYASIIMDPAYVHITKETNLLLDKVKKELNNNGIYTIGRYGAWTYNSMEDCMVTAKELAQKLNGV